jgi:hypothetical protein
MRRRQFAASSFSTGPQVGGPAAGAPGAAGGLASRAFSARSALVATARGTETTEADALDALGRAREILAASSVDAITPVRWHAANRRIWSGYMRRGRRHIVAFELEAALRPLFGALHLRDLDPGLERKTRELLSRTIERISDGAGERIDRLLEAGDRDGAMQRWQDVRGIIQEARDQGLSHEELANAFGRARQVLERIEAAKG